MQENHELLNYLAGIIGVAITDNLIKSVMYLKQFFTMKDVFLSNEIMNFISKYCEEILRYCCAKKEFASEEHKINYTMKIIRDTYEQKFPPLENKNVKNDGEDKPIYSITIEDKPGAECAGTVSFDIRDEALFRTMDDVINKIQKENTGITRQGIFESIVRNVFTNYTNGTIKFEF